MTLRPPDPVLESFVPDTLPAAAAEELRPLLGLVMIVKNEAHGIAETLASFRPYVDRWTILDTGSTDGTQRIILETLADLPGQLFEEPFVDFSTSRNRALDLHGEQTRFAIMPDSDDILEDANQLRAYLQDAERRNVGSFHLNLDWGADLQFYLAVLSSTTGGAYRYKGRVHEVLHGPGTPEKMPVVRFRKVARAESLVATTARWERDKAMLEAELRDSPNDPRSLFYLAQSYDCLGENDRALALYQQRVAVGGWHEETFEAMLRCGRMMVRLGRPWVESQQAFLDAYAFSPERAEPLQEIAQHYHESDHHALTSLFASRASALKHPNATLFVNRHVYDVASHDLAAISTYYVNQRARSPELALQGLRAAERALATNRHDHRLRNNRSFYCRSVGEVYDARVEPLLYHADPPFVSMNPSIHRDDRDGRWRVIVRTTNYRIVHGHYLTPDDNVIHTRNVMLELDDQLRVHTKTPMRDLVGRDLSDYPVHGYEDCRLFRLGDQLLATATVCDLHDSDPVGQREIVLLEIDDDYTIRSATPLRGGWSHLHQKNWMPLANIDNVVDVPIVYSLEPNAVLFVQPPNDKGEIEIGQSGVPGDADEHLRGSSQLVRLVDGSYLCLTHDVSFTFGADGRTDRTYLHRFALLGADMRLRALGELFYLVKRGIEFAAGMAVDAATDRVVVSFAVDDSAAYLATLSLDAVIAGMRPLDESVI